ncbi:MAG TPA: hypothetical protein VFK10_06395 [Burkholderiaceae bacterium]|nr:hypothetical protein [Burkholderiaceae bacterium]
MSTAVREPRSAWLLGPAGPLRVRSSMALTALVVYAVFALVQHGEVMLGLIRRLICSDGAFDGIAPELKVSFSSGLVPVGEGESQDAAIDRADRALYCAKQSGRNRIAAG